METDEIIIKFGHIFTTVSRSILNNYTSIGHVAEKYEIWIANFKLDAQTGHLLQHKQNVHRYRQQHKQLRQQVQRIRLRFLFILLDQ